MRIPLTGAALWSRAAVLTTSPDAMPSPASGLRVEPDERFAGGDPDAQLESLLDGEVTDRERRADGSLGVVLVCRRRAEQGHDRVTYEFLDGAAMAFELGADALVVGAEHRFARPRDRSTPPAP